MPSLYILNVPEFLPLVRTIQTTGVTTSTVGDYTKITTTGEPLTLRRTGAGIRDAVWFAALTGGFTGGITRFDDAELCLEG